MLEYSVEISSEQMEELEALFCEELQQNWLLFQKNAKTTPLLKGYFESKEAFETEADALSARIQGLGFANAAVSKMEDQDWKLAYRHHLKPWNYGSLNWIPEWEREDHTNETGHVYLYLDSGMAFGTGSHETTRLCAEALYDFLDQHKASSSALNVVDAGCGSGILAMSAVLLGCRNVLAFDRDPEAVRVTLENARANELHEKLSIVEAGLEAGFDGVKADCILANIQADVLRIYRDNIVQAWNPQGILILSGILAPEREETTEAFSDTLSAMYPDIVFNVRWDQKGDWVSVIFESK